MDECFADADDHIIFIKTVFEDGVAEQGDLVGQDIAMRPLTLRQRDAFVETVDGVGWFVLDLGKSPARAIEGLEAPREVASPLGPQELVRPDALAGPRQRGGLR